MRRLLVRALLVLLLLSAGGVVVAEDHSAGGPVLSQFSLVALIEAHEPGSDVSLEHHPVCAECTGFASVLGLVTVLSLIAPVVRARRWLRSSFASLTSLAFVPAAPPPR